MITVIQYIEERRLSRKKIKQTQPLPNYQKFMQARIARAKATNEILVGKYGNPEISSTRSVPAVGNKTRLYRYEKQPDGSLVQISYPNPHHRGTVKTARKYAVNTKLIKGK